MKNSCPDCALAGERPAVRDLDLVGEGAQLGELALAEPREEGNGPQLVDLVVGGHCATGYRPGAHPPRGHGARAGRSRSRGGVRRGSSMAGQRSMTTSRPALRARCAAASSMTPSCIQTARAPISIASSHVHPASEARRKMSTTSIGRPRCRGGGRCGSQVRVRRQLVDRRLARIHRNHLVSEAQEGARDAMAGPHRVGAAAYDRPGAGRRAGQPPRQQVRRTAARSPGPGKLLERRLDPAIEGALPACDGRCRAPRLRQGVTQRLEGGDDIGVRARAHRRRPPGLRRGPSP